MNVGPAGPFDPEVARENLKELFGTEGTWVPVSEDVRRRMLADPRYPAPPDTWTSLIDTAILCGKPLRWRGTERQMPIVGRHGLDHETQRPSSTKPLCSNRCEVRVLGGEGQAAQIRGGSQSRGVVHDARDFFFDLDFFIHCPIEAPI